MKNKRLLLVFCLIAIPLLTGNPTRIAAADISSVSMTTNRAEYARGEMINVVVTNGLDIPIWYISYPQPELVFWTVEKAQDNHWTRLSFCLALFENNAEFCRIAMYERPIGIVTKFEPRSELSFEWNQMMCSTTRVVELSAPTMLESGTYRFVFNYSFETVKSEHLQSEPWKRPVELGEINVIYSNEFVVE